MSQKTLEDVLRERAKSGRLNYLSIAFTEAGWEATYRGVEDKDFRSFTHQDITCALRGALTGRAGVEPVATKPVRSKKAVPVDDIFGDL